MTLIPLSLHREGAYVGMHWDDQYNAYVLRITDYEGEDKARMTRFMLLTPDETKKLANLATTG